MEVVANNYLPGDQRLVEKIVYELKSQGIFDQFRKECFADVDTKPAYQNLRQRVEGSVSGFLREQRWKPDMNKNQVREMLRKTITESGYLETGVERIVDQVVNPKISTVFLPKVEEVVYSYLGIKKPNRNEASKSDQSDLLPTDLEAVSPESEPVDKKDDKSADNFQDMDESKTEEDESPPFEPLDEQLVYVPHEENSIDSHLSGFSGLISHESNQSNENKVSSQMELDSQMSRNSSDSRLSIVTSDENSKMDLCEDSQSKSVKSTDSNHKSDDKGDKSKHKGSDKHKSRSENRSDKDRRSSKDSKRHSSSSKDKDKSRDRKDSRSSSNNKNDKDKAKDKDRKSSSKHSSNKDKSVKRDSSRSDKDKARSHKDSKSSDSKSKEKSSSDKHKHVSSSSSHSDRHKKDKDKKKDTKAKDDHYSSKDKRNDRRSTDRDSDGQSSKPNFSSSGSDNNNTQQTQKTSQDLNHGTGDSGNSDQVETTTKAPVIITASVENSEVTIASPETQRVKVFKPKCASNIQEALRLTKIRKQLARLEKENQLSLASVDVKGLQSSTNLGDVKEDEKTKRENDKIVSELEVVPSPLQNTIISQDNWDAMEAKLREEVCSEFIEFNEESLDDSCETKRTVEEKSTKKETEEDCKFFEQVNIEDIEFLRFVDKYVKSVEKYKRQRKGNLHKRKLEDTDVKNNNNKKIKAVPEKKKPVKKNKEKFSNATDITPNEKFPLPLSPAESEKSVGKKDEVVVPSKVKRNSISKMNNQRYSSDDLYKPRPIFTSSRRRGAKNLDN